VGECMRKCWQWQERDVVLDVKKGRKVGELIDLCKGKAGV